MGKRVEEIRGKLDEIASERSKFHLIPGVADTTTGVTEFGPDRETSSVLTEPLIYGRDEDRENIARHVSVVCESAPSPATSNTLFKSPPACRTVLFLDQKTTPPLDHCVSSLSRFKYLRVLDLSYVWTIKVLPPIFGRLKHLRYLNLCNVDLASLPKSVCNLRNLQILNLSYNSKLTVLPSSIGNLKRLRCLDLSGCGIMVFPESICNLTNLRTLNLYECLKLKMLPKSLRNMRNLRSLVIDKHATELTCMPLGIGQLACLRELSTFAVSPVSESAGIRELEELNHLKGELTITGLQHVCDPRDAEQAKLRSKEKLSELRLIWTDGDVEGNNSKEVLERLEPHPNVQVLVIDGYPGVMLPSWVGSSAALISLSLFSMPNVEGWCPLLPSRLGRLELYGCPKLKLPSQLPSSIKVLAVEKCNDPMLNAVKKLPILSYLCISGFAQAETLPEAPLQNLTCLETFIIRDCDKLKSLPTELENLMTLRSLEIGNCGGLESLTEGLSNLTCLKRLAIHNCRSLKSLSQSSLQHLSALETLLLRGCPDLEIMSLGYQHLIALQDLELTSFPQLISFPEEIQHASRLEMLTIYDCKNLRALPDWLLALPVLSKLHISRCHPDLHRRCKDWNRIPHLRFLNEEL
ncbi:hypothetical protein IFM89_027357 [Coptis chinensis]|uniref:Uncharacterized protein n=1 Tax=Coptis chinensis TaxID=261450 RepID=A0A835LIV0_9MAGN|nr:hypothetical protein IFM89_027357 [Coptis chinensis]